LLKVRIGVAWVAAKVNLIVQVGAQMAFCISVPGDPEHADLLNGRWFHITRITERGLDVALALATKPTIGFLDNNLWVATGGNHYYGGYEVDAEGRLVVHHLAGTLVGYEYGGGIDAQEVRITAALGAGPTVGCVGEDLRLETDAVTLYGLEVARPASSAGWITRRW
jgi:hypothetical protein